MTHDEDHDNNSLEYEEDNFLAVDVDALQWLMPDVNTAWRGLAGICQNTYNTVQAMVVDDANHVAQLLLDLEQQDDERGRRCQVTRTQSAHPGPSRPLYQPNLYSSVDIQPRPARKRRRPTTSLRHGHGHGQRPLRSPSPHPMHIPNTHPSAPSILITPSAPQPRASAFVSAPPVQDSCCGSRLTLPRVVMHSHRASSSSSSSSPSGLIMVDAERGRRRRGGVLLGRTVLGVGVGMGRKGR